MLWKKGRRSDNVVDARDDSGGGGGGMRFGGGKGLQRRCWVTRDAEDNSVVTFESGLLIADGTQFARAGGGKGKGVKHHSIITSSSATVLSSA